MPQAYSLEDLAFMAQKNVGAPLPWLDERGVLRSEFSDAMGRTARAAKRHPVKGAVLAREIWEMELGEKERQLAQSLSKDPDALARFMFAGIDNAGFVPELADWRASTRQKQLLFELRRANAKKRAQAEGEARPSAPRQDEPMASFSPRRHAKGPLNAHRALALGGVDGTVALSPQIAAQTAIAGFVSGVILLAASFARLPAARRFPARLWGRVRDAMGVLRAQFHLKAAWPLACAKNQRAARAHWKKNGAEKAAGALSRLPVGMDSPSRRRTLSNAMMQCLDAESGAPGPIFAQEATRVMQSVSLEGFGERMAKRERGAIAQEWAAVDDAQERKIASKAPKDAAPKNPARNMPPAPRRL